MQIDTPVPSSLVKIILRSVFGHESVNCTNKQAAGFVLIKSLSLTTTTTITIGKLATEMQPQFLMTDASLA